MQYWEVVMGSFRIAWRHRYLWLLALFAGEGGGSFSANTGTTGRGFGGNTGGKGGGSSPDPAQIAQQAATWLHDHVGLVIATGVALLVILVVFFVLAAVCEAAVVRAAAEHDAQRPFGLGQAWRSGVSRMGSMIRFRLLLLLLGLPIVIVIGGLAAGLALGAINNQTVVTVVFGALLVVFGLAAVVYLIYLSFLDRLGSRALILEQLEARASLSRGHRLLFKRFGRTLVVWLISIGVGIAVGVAISIVFVIIALPAIGIAIAAAVSSNAVLWVVFALYIALFILVAIVVGSFIAAQGSTYWTLAFRRLDLDSAPAFAPAYPSAAPPAATA